MPLEDYGKEFKEWLNGMGGDVIKLNKPVQADKSILCGLFVLYFMFHLSRGRSLPAILRLFSNRLRCNDKIVLCFARQKLRYTGRIKQLQCRRNMGIYKSKLSTDFNETKKNGRKS